MSNITDKELENIARGRVSDYLERLKVATFNIPCLTRKNDDESFEEIFEGWRKRMENKIAELNSIEIPVYPSTKNEIPF